MLVIFKSFNDFWKTLNILIKSLQISNFSNFLHLSILDAKNKNVENRKKKYLSRRTQVFWQYFESWSPTEYIHFHPNFLAQKGIPLFYGVPELAEHLRALSSLLRHVPVDKRGSMTQVIRDMHLLSFNELRVSSPTSYPKAGNENSAV